MVSVLVPHVLPCPASPSPDIRLVSQEYLRQFIPPDDQSSDPACGWHTRPRGRPGRTSATAARSRRRARTPSPDRPSRHLTDTLPALRQLPLQEPGQDGDHLRGTDPDRQHPARHRNRLTQGRGARGECRLRASRGRSTPPGSQAPATRAAGWRDRDLERLLPEVCRGPAVRVARLRQQPGAGHAGPVCFGKGGAQPATPPAAACRPAPRVSPP